MPSFQSVGAKGGRSNRNVTRRVRWILSALLDVLEMVGAVGFEPTTSWSRTKRATKLRYAPTRPIIKHLEIFHEEFAADL